MHPMSRTARLLGGFVVISLLGGLLLSALSMPGIAAAGRGAVSVVGAFEALPSRLPSGGVAEGSRILDAGGHVIATPHALDRTVVPLAKIAPIMRKAQVAIEDSRFYEHGALDARGLSRALVATLGGRTEGASTITQQYVKLTLQADALGRGNERAAAAAVTRQGMAGVARKLQELRYAAELERTRSKDAILAGYLNLAYYGDQAYGVEAAAQAYFSVHAADLTYVQAALLAGLVRQPSATDPLTHPQAAFQRRNVVLDRMAQLRIITPRQAAAGKRVPIAAMLQPSDRAGTCAASSEPYFCEYVIAWLEQDPALGADATARADRIASGGLTIRTTLRPGWSGMIRDLLKQRVAVDDSSGVGSAATIVEPGTGRILAMGQTSRFSGSHGTQIDWNADAAYGGSTYGFQFGSTAKMFTLATAFAQGMSEGDSVDAKAAGPSRPATYTPSENSDSCTDWNTWQVHNDSTWGGGPMSLRRATAQSVNSAFASLTLKVGLCHVLDTMAALGLHLGNGKPLPKVATMALGAGTVSPVTLASAYAAIAAKGVYCSPVPVVSVTARGGRRLPIRGAGCHQAIDPDVASSVARILQAPLDDPGGTAYGLGLPGRPAAGKTGTTDGHVQTWFVGFTPQLATAVWVGTPQRQFSMAGHTIGGVYYPAVFGATIAAPAWQDIMTKASDGMPVEQLG